MTTDFEERDDDVGYSTNASIYTVTLYSESFAHVNMAFAHDFDQSHLPRRFVESGEQGTMSKGSKARYTSNLI